MRKSSLEKRTKEVAALLRSGHERLVLAESCTGGLLAAAMTEIPGISEYFCGSLVVYRERSKRDWLGVGATTLKKHSAVSPHVAVAMVRGALKRTPEATIAGAVTGYLGPTGAHLGLVYLAVLRRGSRTPTLTKLEIARIGGSPLTARLRRREIAAEKLLVALTLLLKSNA